MDYCAIAITANDPNDPNRTTRCESSITHKITAERNGQREDIAHLCTEHANDDEAVQEFIDELPSLWTRASEASNFDVVPA